MEIQMLKDLNFAPGIKAKDINDNFNLIHDWLRRERLRTGGWGLVEGFDLHAEIPDDPKQMMRVTVGDGIMVNQDGEEVTVPGKEFEVPAIDIIKVEDTVTELQEDGYIKLKHRPYSVSQRGFFQFTQNVDTLYPKKEEFLITSTVDGHRHHVVQIDGDKVYVNVEEAQGKELVISYYTVADRVDSIMLYKDGAYKYEVSINSTSPSHVELGDYDSCYMIGVVYWHIDTETEAQFFTDHRTYRKVYVDEQNRLWLNGKLYKEAQIIYMEEPEDPQPNDIWYDGKNNCLMIWREKDGIYGWVLMNQDASIEERQVKIFYPGTKEYPADNQHFRFREDEMNFHFVPGQHALEIVIDNVPVMRDQFDEYVPAATDKRYMALGKGFDLKDPLDRATPVEVLVRHTVKEAPVRETFQRAAIFIVEGYDHYVPTNTKKIFETTSAYVINDNQLEVFLDGRRLTKGVDYVEMKDDKVDAAAGDKGSMSTHFRVLIAVANGQLVTHKISKHVWSFDQVNQMMKDIEGKADQALLKTAQLQTDLDTLNHNTTEQIQTTKTSVANLERKIGDPSTYVKKTDTIAYDKLPQELKDRLMGEQINMTAPAKGTITIPNTKITDFFIVNYVSANMNRALIKGSEYTPVQVGNNIRIDLKPNYAVSEASVYITGIKMGV